MLWAKVALEVFQVASVENFEIAGTGDGDAVEFAVAGTDPRRLDYRVYID